MTLQPGAILGPYEIVSLLGAGGMGEVYLARELSLGRRVALKVLPQEFTHDAQRIARFEQEARSASALSHPNICTIYALGEAPDGRHFIAMEYIEGQTLRGLLSSGPLGLKQALDICIQIAAALSDAHAAGVLHRDIKPENVMMRSDGLAKVLDFGLAKLARPSTPDAEDTTRTAFNTNPGTVLGTVAYMSPEQARGQNVDARSDIWALGVVLYETVAGRNPFGGDSSSDVLAAILDRDPAPLARFDPSVQAEVQRIVSKALQKHRGERYQTVKDLLLDLKRVAIDGGASHPVGLSPWWRRRSLVALGAALIACSTIVLGWGYWRSARHQAPQPVAERVLRRITFGAGLQTDPTFSPDGRYIAFASDRGGNLDVWVQAVAGGDAVRITKSEANDVEPDWSPDGSTIAFRSDRDGGGLYVVPALGGAERRIATFGVTPRWSPDGSTILFASALSEIVGLGAPKLYLVDPTAAAAVREFAPAFTRRLTFSGGFDWHPDGKAVSVYAMLLDGTLGVFNVAADGRIVSSFTDKTEVGLDPRSSIRWSKSAEHLFVDGIKAGVRSLWRFKADRDAHILVEDGRLTTGAGQDGRLVVSRDGKRIAFVSEKYGARLWSYPLDRAGRTADLSAGQPLTDADSHVESIDLDAKGDQVVYTVMSSGSETRELRLHNLSTGVTDTITSDGTVRFLPQWSHSAAAIAYVRSRSITGEVPSDVAVWRIGGEEEVIGALTSTKIGFLTFDWTPSDDGIVASYQESEIGPYFFVLVDPRQRAKSVTWTTLLRDDRYNFWQATYSPNGQWMAFSAQSRKDRPARAADPVSGELALMRVGQTDWKLVLPGWELDKPRWSADGRLLYFVARKGQVPHNVWGVEFDERSGSVRGDPFQVTHFDGVRQGFISDLVTAEIGVSARRLLIPVRERSGSIWMLDETAAGPPLQ